MLKLRPSSKIIPLTQVIRFKLRSQSLTLTRKDQNHDKHISEKKMNTRVWANLHSMKVASINVSGIILSFVKEEILDVITAWIQVSNLFGIALKSNKALILGESYVFNNGFVKVVIEADVDSRDECASGM